MITEDFVSFETAKLLKEKGFPQNTSHYYEGKNLWRHYHDEVLPKTEIFAAPTHQMAMKWLREEHNRFIEICTDKAHNFKDIIFRPAIYNKELYCLWESDNFPTYENACEATIKYCLENLI